MADWKKEDLPRHVGIIMDGNGRWAQKRGLPRSAGHVAGAKTFRTIARYASDIGIEVLTVYAFSTENWSRPLEEVQSLMKLFKSYLEEAISDFADDTIRIRFLGDTTAFPQPLQELIARVEEMSATRNGMWLNLAMNYGGRTELVHAMQQLAAQVQQGTLRPEDITQERIAKHLYTAGQPDPDLIIRPSGEQRLSNFLLWQAAYAEFVYEDVLWPDFTTKDLDAALRVFAGRNRRFGGV